MSNFTKYLSKNWLDDPKSNILSGLVVAFAMIPEAIAFSGIACLLYTSDAADDS